MSFGDLMVSDDKNERKLMLDKRSKYDSTNTTYSFL
jgi:hypothetical protein